MKYFLLFFFFIVPVTFSQTTKQIKKITFVVDENISLNLGQGVMGIKEGDYIKDSDVKKEILKLNQYLYSRGYLKSKISHKKIALENGIEIVFTISAEKIAKIVDLKVTSDSIYILKEYEKKITNIKNKPFNNLNTKIILDEIGKEIFESGYYYSKVSFKKRIISEDQNGIAEYGLNIHIHFGFQYNFNFMGNVALSRFELIDFIRQSISTNKNDNPDKRIRYSILDKYKSLGIYGTSVNMRSERAISVNNKVVMRNFFIKIKEGKKIVLKNFVVDGNQAVSLEEIIDFYYENATPLAMQGYFDKNYLTGFADILKREYLKKGFVFASISEPDIAFYQARNEADVIYNIDEQKQCILRKINLDGIDPELAEIIRKALTNKESKPLNILEIENDIKKSIDIVRKDGYFFAKIKNFSEKKFITYSPQGSSAEINIGFNLGKKGVYQNTSIKGNIYTDYGVIEREIDFKKNEIITLEKINTIRENLSSMGLFSQVKITPNIVNKSDSEAEMYEVELLIEVEEKNFGNAEFSLGYRTDIGVRLSAIVSHNNLWKRHHSFSTKGQINQRLDYNSLDFRRRTEKKNRLEGLGEINYVWPYFVDSFGLNTRFGFERKRFFAFDADILRVAPQINKQVSSALSVSLGYQFERIHQFDATEEKDRDTFKIGSLTPTLTLDYRDHSIKPRKGAFFRLSWEFANPNFSFNRESENNSIDFSKLVSRNKFYFSYGNWTLALSLVVGAQWNWAKEWLYDEEGNNILNSDGSWRTVGHIPSIKVFRLDGIDAVRGFSYEEINRTYSGDDISELRIQNRAYFTNIKWEPRYYWGDSFVMGVFIDAGGLSIDHYQPLKLRYAAGLSLKILTLVGTLDFDYGVKFRRRRLALGEREKFGRFHLSIGHF